jgi:thioredoxin 1
MRRTLIFIIGIVVVFMVTACTKAGTDYVKNGKNVPPGINTPIVTFIELGSVNCVPCKAMQPVMEEVRQKYGKQVSVVFHDVWTKEGEPFGKKYQIRVIPTQVFLDKEGNEYYRHEGFFPAADLYKVLEKGGVTL